MIVLLLPFAIEEIVIGYTSTLLYHSLYTQPGSESAAGPWRLLCQRPAASALVQQAATGCHKSAGLRGLVSGNNYLLELPPRTYNNRR